MILISIDVKKLDKARFKPGKTPTPKPGEQPKPQPLYCDLVLFENKNGVDQYGNNGIVKQGQSKEDRAARKETPIIGNWKHVGQSSSPGQANPPAGEDPDDEKVPF